MDIEMNLKEFANYWMEVYDDKELTVGGSDLWDFAKRM